MVLNVGNIRQTKSLSSWDFIIMGSMDNKQMSIKYICYPVSYTMKRKAIVRSHKVMGAANINRYLSNKITSPQYN